MLRSLARVAATSLPRAPLVSRLLPAQISAPTARGLATASASAEEEPLPLSRTTNATQRASGGDPSRRTFAYSMAAATGFFYAASAKNIVVDLLDTMSMSADVRALGSLEVNLSEVAEGSCLVVGFRGKPLFVRHRTPAEIEMATSVDVSKLPDPQTDAERVQNPKYMIVVGVCTHLGCIPLNGAGKYNGWFCPCHGSHYDTSGRIREGPAPRNLEIPPYQFVDDENILVG